MAEVVEPDDVLEIVPRYAAHGVQTKQPQYVNSTLILHECQFPACSSPVNGTFNLQQNYIFRGSHGAEKSAWAMPRATSCKFLNAWLQLIIVRYSSNRYIRLIPRVGALVIFPCGLHLSIRCTFNDQAPCVVAKLLVGFDDDQRKSGRRYILVVGERASAETGNRKLGEFSTCNNVETASLGAR